MSLTLHRKSGQGLWVGDAYITVNLERSPLGRTRDSIRVEIDAPASVRIARVELVDAPSVRQSRD